MRIAFVTKTLHGSTFIIRKCNFLVGQGHSVTVFCRAASAYNAEQVHPAVRVVQLPEMHCWRGWLALVRSVWLVAWVPLLRAGYGLLARGRGGELRAMLASHIRLAPVRAGRWDLVHVHFLSNLEGVRWIRPLMKCPVVASALGYDVTVAPFKTPDGAAENLSRATHAGWPLEVVDGLIYSTESLRSNVHAHAEVSVPEKIVYPEVAESLFNSRQRTEPHVPLRILTVGNLVWAKGYPYALSAVRMLLDRGMPCEYRIVGDGEARQELEFAIRQLELVDHVALLGAVPSDVVARHMAWADVFLLLSVRESFGLVLAEAQESGVPVVATRVDGIPEATQEGATALLVPPRDPEAAADALVRLVRDRELFARLSDNGPRWAERFRSARVGQELVAFYRHVIEVQGQARSQREASIARAKAEDDRRGK